MFFSSSFFIGFPVAVLLYYVLPQKVRKLYLLAVSYIFYVIVMDSSIIWLLVITLLSFGMGKVVAKARNQSGRKIIVFLSVGMLIGSLFFVRNNSLFSAVGVSFYGLQAISYILDIYFSKISSESNLLSYALYIAFFPKILSGPIEKYEKFATEIRKLPTAISYEKFKHACCIMLWGYFQKIVIADHAALIVNNVFDNMYNNSGVEMLVAAVLYAVQLYADFDGYTHIALGASSMLGIELSPNFRQPYFSISIKEFWQRWHCSLSAWLKEYVYIPLGGNRKGILRQNVNLILTFMISGLWHGRGFKFLFWGFLHGCYQVGERLLDNWKLPQRKVFNVIRGVITFILVDVAWIFFRADSLRSGLFYCYRMVTDAAMWQFKLLWTKHFQIEPVVIMTMLLGVFVLFIVDYIRYKKVGLYDWLAKQKVVVRWSIYYGLLLVIVCAYLQTYGYDVSNFIYAQF